MDDKKKSFKFNGYFPQLDLKNLRVKFPHLQS